MTPRQARSDDGARQLRALEAVALSDSRARPQVVLEAARDALRMEIAYFSEFTSGDQVIRAAAGDTEPFGFGPETAVPLEQTYCRRMVAGEIPNLVADTHAEPGLSDLPATSGGGIRTYIGVPVQLPAGRVYGTLCCASREPNVRSAESDVRFLRILARLLGDELDRHEQTHETTAERPSAHEDAASARLSLWFAGAPRAAQAARRAIASLSDQVPEDTLYQLNLLVTELVTNAVRHAGIGPTNSVGLEVTVCDDVISGAVSDPGAGFDVDVGIPDPLDEGGRGLFLVEQIALRWGVENDPGTRVWFELANRPADSEATGRAA